MKQFFSPHRQQEGSLSKLYLLLMGMILLMVTVACNSDSYFLDKLRILQQQAEKAPEISLKELDAMKPRRKDVPPYAQMKYDVLQLQLLELLHRPFPADMDLETVTATADTKGSRREQQEAHYYAGRVYRFRGEQARAMEQFFSATECSEQQEPLDTLLMQSTYHNLYELFAEVNDYGNALYMARKEMAWAGNRSRLPIVHLAVSYEHLGQKDEAWAYYLRAYRQLNVVGLDVIQEYAAILLRYLSSQKMQTEADEVYVKLKDVDRITAQSLIALAGYFAMKGDGKNVVNCYQQVLTRHGGLQNRYDAARGLFEYYRARGNSGAMRRYAHETMVLAEKMELAQNQKMADAVVKQFQYNRQSKEKVAALAQSDRYRVLLLSVALLFMVFAALVILIYYRRKNQMLRQTITLKETQRKLADVKAEIMRYDAELRQKEEELANRVNQNNAYLRMLHQTAVEVRSADIIKALKLTAEGRHHMTSDEWRQFFHAVDETYPTFSQGLAGRLGNVDEQVLRFCYLQKAGMTTVQIMNLMPLSRTTVWRWNKKYGEIRDL